MAKFRVGQKVKIIATRYPENAYLIGLTGQIVEFGENREGMSCARLDIRKKNGDLAFMDLKNIVPTYDGNEKISWEAMEGLWQPDKATT